MKKMSAYFTKGERTLWGVSAGLILISFLIFDRVNLMTLAASLIGITSLIFNAKGNPIGQALMILFSLLYGLISYTFFYFGEMITYLGMTAPSAVATAIAWMRHPYQDSREVEVCRVTLVQVRNLILLTAAATALFYFVLRAMGNASLIVSTISIATSVVAACLTFMRSLYYALGYAANDLVLIVLWSIAAAQDISCLPMLLCFVMFLLNDLYGFFNWRRMMKRQSA